LGSPRGFKNKTGGFGATLFRKEELGLQGEHCGDYSPPQKRFVFLSFLQPPIIEEWCDLLLEKLGAPQNVCGY